jgi:hypothetical protein
MPDSDKYHIFLSYAESRLKKKDRKIEMLLFVKKKGTCGGEERQERVMG